MNHFAEQLSEELDAMGLLRATAAEQFDIPATTLSRLANAKEGCSEKQLAKILPKVAPEAAAKLAAAWLRDRIPNEIPAGTITIAIDKSVVREDPVKYAMEEWPIVDKELRAATIDLLKRAQKHPEIRNILLSISEGMSLAPRKEQR